MKMQNQLSLICRKRFHFKKSVYSFICRDTVSNNITGGFNATGCKWFLLHQFACLAFLKNTKYRKLKKPRPFTPGF
jgi:hypothetical protein